MEMIGKTPQEIDGMTLSEILVACIDQEKETSGEEMSPIEMVAYLDWWKNMTPEQRLFAEA